MPFTESELYNVRRSLDRLNRNGRFDDAARLRSYAEALGIDLDNDLPTSEITSDTSTWIDDSVDNPLMQISGPNISGAEYSFSNYPEHMSSSKTRDKKTKAKNEEILIELQDLVKDKEKTKGCLYKHSTSFFGLALLKKESRYFLVKVDKNKKILGYIANDGSVISSRRFAPEFYDEKSAIKAVLGLWQTKMSLQETGNFLRNQADVLINGDSSVASSAECLRNAASILHELRKSINLYGDYSD